MAQPVAERSHSLLAGPAYLSAPPGGLHLAEPLPAAQEGCSSQARCHEALECVEVAVQHGGDRLMVDDLEPNPVGYP
jgi:hypothetical protein